MRLEKRELFEVIEKCLKNAQELFEEAEILKEHKRYARSYTLFQICIEEVGKTSLIYKFLLDPNKNDNSTVKKFIANFRDHKAKIVTSIAYDKMLVPIIESEEDNELKQKWESEILNQLNSVNKYNDYKNYSLYTSFYDNDFCIPSELFTLDNLISIQYLSKIRLNMANDFYEVAKTKIDEF